MIEKIIEYSVRNPFLIIIAALAVAGFGLYSVINTPVDAIPDLSENQVIVFADWMGRSPREVEDQVTYPLSVNLQGLAGVKAVRATSEFGFSMVNIIFEDKVDFYFARERVLERLSIASTFLPPGVSPYLAPDATALGQIFWYTVEGEGQDPGRLRAIQDWFIRYQLYSVPGVAEVASVGGFPIEYQIDIDPNKLRAYGVTLGELYSAVMRSNSAVGGRILQKGNSEYLIRSAGWIQSLADIENIVVKSVQGVPISVGNVAIVQQGPGLRRASLEKNGNEVTGGVVLMRYGENPLDVTRRIKKKIEELQPGLPEGVRIVPFYERTRLIEDAIHTVTGTLREEMIVASLLILLVMWHFRSALIVCVTLPVAILIAFILMRTIGIASNIMSLSGIAISIGVLVDSSIVMVENATHHLHGHFGTAKVHGKTGELVLPALRTVGRPIFFSVMIMLISFVPVFALQGMEGRMFHPLAFTKSFAMIGVAILSITLVPALVPLLVRGRLRGEEESWIVRSVIEIYRPVLRYVLEHPWPIVWLTGLILVLGTLPMGTGRVAEFAFRGVFLLALVGVYWSVGKTFKGGWVRWGMRGSLMAALALVVAIADSRMGDLGWDYMPPLDEGTILDMPVTIPRASITEAADDLKARDAMLRMFPEVELVVGKAGRAETPTDPAPPDMVETVVNLYPRAYWPKRELRYEDAERLAVEALAAMEKLGWLVPLTDEQRKDLTSGATMFALAKYDDELRNTTVSEFAVFKQTLIPELSKFAVTEILGRLQREGKLLRPAGDDDILTISEALASTHGQRLAELPDSVGVNRFVDALAAHLTKEGWVKSNAVVLSLKPEGFHRLIQDTAELLGAERQTIVSTLLADIEKQRDKLWREHVKQLNWKLFDQAVPLFAWQSVDSLKREMTERKLWSADGSATNRLPAAADAFRELAASLEGPFRDRLFLWQRTKDGLLKEMDTVVHMPGWGNIWTQPIVNRVDMLATGVRTMIGVKVFGDDLNKIQQVSEEIAAVLKGVRGAADVFPDQIVGEGYLQIDIDREKAARYGLNVGDVQDVVETALGGKMITMTVEGRERFPVRIRYARAFREDEESVRNLLVSAPGGMQSANISLGGMSGDSSQLAMTPSTGSSPTLPGAATGAPPSAAIQIPLAQIADVKIVEGPSMIKSENGLLRSYVQLNVRDRDLLGFVDEARRVVAERVPMPSGMYIEWSGQFEHQVRANRTLSLIIPAVIALILVILYITYNDFVDAALMMLAVPGAVAGGVLFQWMFGFNFSVAVSVGFIACLGLATETGIVMLVYLREAIEKRGGLENITLEELREAVMEGAVHRLRPKLLTEGTTIIGLAPMLWATGTGAEIMQPMAAPVLGGILVADEVIDMLLPVLFYHVRAWRWKKLDNKRESTSATLRRLPTTEQSERKTTT